MYAGHGGPPMYAGPGGPLVYAGPGGPPVYAGPGGAPLCMLVLGAPLCMLVLEGPMYAGFGSNHNCNLRILTSNTFCLFRCFMVTGVKKPHYVRYSYACHEAQHSQCFQSAV